MMSFEDDNHLNDVSMLYRVPSIEKGPYSSPIQVPPKPHEALESHTENELTPRILVSWNATAFGSALKTQCWIEIRARNKHDRR